MGLWVQSQSGLHTSRHFNTPQPKLWLWWWMTGQGSSCLTVQTQTIKTKTIEGSPSRSLWGPAHLFLNIFKIFKKIYYICSILPVDQKRAPDLIIGGYKPPCSCWELRKGWAIQRLPHPGIHPIISHRTQTLLHMPERFCWRDPVIAVSYEAMPVPGKYRSGCSHLSIGWNTGPPMKELEKAPKELKGSATL